MSSNTRNSVWLMIEDELVLFGAGGVSRAARVDTFNQATQKPSVYTQLYNNQNSCVTQVEVTPEEIFELLRDYYSSEKV